MRNIRGRSRMSRWVLCIVALLLWVGSNSDASAAPPSGGSPGNPFDMVQAEINSLTTMVTTLQSQVTALQNQQSALTGVTLAFSADGIASDLQEVTPLFQITIPNNPPPGVDNFQKSDSFTALTSTQPDPNNTPITYLQQVGSNIDPTVMALVAGSTSPASLSVSVVDGVVTGTLSGPTFSFALTGLQLLGPSTGVASAGLPVVPASLPVGTNPPVAMPVSMSVPSGAAVPAALLAQAAPPDILRFTVGGPGNTGEALSAILIYVRSAGRVFLHGLVVNPFKSHYKVRTPSGGFSVRG